MPASPRRGGRNREEQEHYTETYQLHLLTGGEQDCSKGNMSLSKALRNSPPADGRCTAKNSMPRRTEMPTATDDHQGLVDMSILKGEDVNVGEEEAGRGYDSKESDMP